MRLSKCCLGGHFKVLVVGAGAGGVGISSKLARILPKGSLGLVDPHQTHFYQPGFTLVGGGLSPLTAHKKPQRDFIPNNCDWIKEYAKKIVPEKNTVELSGGDTVTYDHLVLALGLQLRYGMIKGLPEGLDAPGVCSIYKGEYAEKTFKEIQNFKSGNCIFTFPNTPIKCAGAPQKILYLAEDMIRKAGKRDKANMHYYTALPKVFGVDAYAKSLMNVIKERNIELHTKHSLSEVDTQNKIATFDVLNGESKPTGEKKQIEYSLLHVGAPCSAVPVLRECSSLTDASGWVDVDPQTLQSRHFSNVFGIGDCINTPNAKTAAAVVTTRQRKVKFDNTRTISASQLRTLGANLKAVLNGKELPGRFDGYASCPILIGRNQGILAEFNSEGTLETFPIDQSKPRYTSYLMKRYILPPLYWHGLLRGIWNGPKTMRKIFHLGMSK